MKENTDGTMTLSVKVRKPTAESIARLCRKKGITYNELQRNTIETFVKYMSDAYNLQPDMETAIQLFENTDGWKDAFNLCDPNTNPEIVFAAYFLQDTTGKKGIRSVLVEKPYFGIWTQTENVNEIFERVFCTVLPTQYRRLRSLGSQLGSNSVIETIARLLSMYGDDADQRAYREMFEDANRSEFGLKPHEGAPFRRKKHYTPDNQPGLDFRPFDQEE